MKKINLTGERMVPEENKNELIYFEHMARYHFANQFIKGKNVLDVACGTGYGSYLMINAGAEKVTGLDIDSKTINYAKKLYKVPGLHFQKGDAHKIPFKDKTFDVLVSFETIEHLTNPELFLLESKRVLKENGILVISTPNKYEYPKGNKFHIKEFTPNEMGNLLKKFFSETKFFYQDTVFSNYTFEKKSLETGRHEFTKIDSKSIKMFDKPPDKNIYMVIICSNVLIKKTQSINLLFNIKGEEHLSKILEENNSLKIEVKNLDKAIKDQDKDLKKLYGSRGWKIISFLHNLRTKIPTLKNLK